MDSIQVTLAKMNDLKALLRPDTSAFETQLRRITGYWHRDAADREWYITVEVFRHNIEQMNTPWWRR
jgi:hypothetical protein